MTTFLSLFDNIPSAVISSSYAMEPLLSSPEQINLFEAKTSQQTWFSNWTSDNKH